MDGQAGPSAFSGFPVRRLRRMRRTPALRRMVAETTLSVDDLVAPLFVRRGSTGPCPIASLPGPWPAHAGVPWSVEAKRLASLGIPALVLFGIPATKDATGSGAWDPDGDRAVGARRDCERHSATSWCSSQTSVSTSTPITGTAACSASTETVDNDATFELYQRVALAQAEAGADVVAPSGMMDGQVGADPHGPRRLRAEPTRPSSPTRPSTRRRLYGPFRDAVDVTIAGGGDRRGYQQDLRNRREALAEVALDVAEGADMVMVKPALAYLDVIAEVAPKRRRAGRRVPRER